MLKGLKFEIKGEMSSFSLFFCFSVSFADANADADADGGIDEKGLDMSAAGSCADDTCRDMLA